MATVAARLRENAAGVTVFLVLGAGLLALGLGYSWFWVIFAVGFAVLLPLVGMLTAGEEQEDGGLTNRIPRWRSSVTGTPAGS